MNTSNFRKTNKNQSFLCIVITIFIVLMIILVIQQQSKSWLQIKHLEESFKHQFKNLRQQYMQNKLKRQNQFQNKNEYQGPKCISLPLIVEGNHINIHIYQPEQFSQEIERLNNTPYNCKNQRGTILYILGAGVHVFAWEKQFLQLTKLGYNIVCLREKQTLDVYKDVLIHQTIWQQAMQYLKQQNPQIIQKERIVIGHCFGALIASFLTINTKYFTKLILLTPFFGINIKFTIGAMDLWMRFKRSLDCKKRENTNYQKNKKNYISLSKIIKIYLIQQELMNFKQSCPTSLCLILAQHEHLISNQTALQFFNNFQQKQKKLVFSDSITHVANGQEIIKILGEQLLQN